MDKDSTIESVKKMNLPAGKYAIFGSGPLGIRGIRESNDADIIVADELWEKLANDPSWKPSINALGVQILQRDGVEIIKTWRPGEWNVDELIGDAELIGGLPFVKLEQVLKWKRLFGREKDLKDIELVEEYLKKENYDLHKAGGILLKNGKLLVARPKNRDIFAAPGGKLEKSETARQSLIRELNEEFGIFVNENDLKEFGTFFAQAAGDENKKLRMDVFVVNSWDGEINPAGEIDEIMWVDSISAPNIKIGSIFAGTVIPELKSKGLIG